MQKVKLIIGGIAAIVIGEIIRRFSFYLPNPAESGYPAGAIGMIAMLIIGAGAVALLYGIVGKKKMERFSEKLFEDEFEK